MQSVLSIDDNQMILNSIDTSDTEVTFSVNLDDLGIFINDPYFYFTVNGEVVSYGYGTMLSDLVVRDQDDYVQFNPNDSRVDSPEVTYNSESNIATFTYDVSQQNSGLYLEDYEILIGLSTFSETIARSFNSDGLFLIIGSCTIIIPDIPWGAKAITSTNIIP